MMDQWLQHGGSIRQSAKMAVPLRRTIEKTDETKPILAVEEASGAEIEPRRNEPNGILGGMYRLFGPIVARRPDGQ
jgi:hypothetical protein